MTDRKTWEQRVAGWRASGQSAREFAEGRDYTVHMLRYWAQRIEKEAAKVEPVRLARVVRVLTATRFRRDLTVFVENHQAAGGGGDLVRAMEPGQEDLRRDLLVVGLGRSGSSRCLSR